MGVSSMDDVCILIKETVTPDEIGNQLTGKDQRQVYCRTRSLTRSEWYGASQAGLNPSLVIILSNSMDYEGEKIVKFHGELYSVLRTYQGTGDAIELTLEPKVGVKNG